MKARTKTDFEQVSPGSTGGALRRPAWRRRNERASRASPRTDRDRTRGGVRPYTDADAQGFDVSGPDRENHSDPTLLDVEFDHDELGELILGQAGSVARAIAHEEDEAFWL